MKIQTYTIPWQRHDEAVENEYQTVLLRTPISKQFQKQLMRQLPQLRCLFPNRVVFIRDGVPFLSQTKKKFEYSVLEIKNQERTCAHSKLRSKKRRSSSRIFHNDQEIKSFSSEHVQIEGFSNLMLSWIYQTCLFNADIFCGVASKTTVGMCLLA